MSVCECVWVCTYVSVYGSVSVCVGVYVSECVCVCVCGRGRTFEIVLVPRNVFTKRLLDESVRRLTGIANEKFNVEILHPE